MSHSPPGGELSSPRPLPKKTSGTYPARAHRKHPPPAITSSTHASPGGPTSKPRPRLCKKNSTHFTTSSVWREEGDRGERKRACAEASGCKTASHMGTRHFTTHTQRSATRAWGTGLHRCHLGFWRARRRRRRSSPLSQGARFMTPQTPALPRANKLPAAENSFIYIYSEITSNATTSGDVFEDGEGEGPVVGVHIWS